MSCRRKSEYGWNVARFSAATGLGPVCSDAWWHLPHPISWNSDSPAVTSSVIVPRAGGASIVMKSVSADTSRPSSLSAGVNRGPRDQDDSHVSTPLH